MRPERWKRIEALFHEASAKPPAERAPFLAAACSDDEALRRDVEALLAETESDEGLLADAALVVPPQLGLDLTIAPMIGQSLAGYQLQALIGAGGMGEVYRAHDSKLARDVAIKILPPAFTTNPDRLARFEREARLLAALNHPNICGIYGLEEADGIRFLILELVPGDSLAQMLSNDSSAPTKGKALPLADALAIARQITDALEAAHEKGIVHRDLKPANIKITPDGTVKVLDFGIAKAVRGDGQSALSHPAVATASGTREGTVIGTAAYMSPEQARGLAVDKRTDIWAVGCVLYEMLTGGVAFAGDTVSDSIAKILEREPDWSALPASTPPSIRRLLFRCLMKDPKRRLRDIGDVRIEIDGVGEVVDAPGAPHDRAKSRTWWLPWAAVAALAIGMGIREARRPAPPWENPLADAVFSKVTSWEGTEYRPDISPDGRFVAFLADREGQVDIWVTQLGTGAFDNLTAALPGLLTAGNLLRSHGFSGNGSEIWFNPQGNPGREKVLMPLTGGQPRAFLPANHSTPAWSADNTRIAFIVSGGIPGDPMSIADHTGADAHPIVVQGEPEFFRRGVHAHNPVWSADNQWLYFTYGPDPYGDMDIWRMRPSGESPEQLTRQNAPVSFLAPLDSQTLLYVARAEDWSGPWLWALDLVSRATRRVTVGLEQYTSVSASRDGSRIVASVADPKASLWRVPLLDRPADEREAELYAMPTARALSPRFGGRTLFYLSQSSQGAGDGLWRVDNGQAFEVRKGAGGVLSEPPAVSPDGSRVAVVVRQHGKRRLAIMSADGTGSRTLAPSLEIQGVVGQPTADWSPDGISIVTGADDGQGPGLFKIPVAGGTLERIVEGEARAPVWSPKGDLIIYAVPFGGAGGLDALRAVRPDGTPVQIRETAVHLGGAHRFLRDGSGLVYLPGIEARDFWLLDLTNNTSRQLTTLRDRGYLRGFDITPDGKHLLFDRAHDNSDVVLIERPAKPAR